MNRSILLIEDNPHNRYLACFLLRARGWEVIEAEDGPDGLRVAADVAPAVILLDIQLPDGHGLDNLAQLQALVPGCPVLLMSAQVDAERLAQAQQRGAAGLMAKVASAREIVTAVRAALSGTPTFAMASPLPRPEPIRVPLGGAFADESLDALSGEGSANEPTPRQRAILSYLGRGTPNKAIARQMGLSENEVRAEVSFLTERLNATSRQQAYAEAVARGWVAP